MGKRGTACTVCTSDKRHLVEVGLTHGVSCRLLAKRYGLSHHAVSRHSRSHLSPQIRAAILAAQKPADVDLEALRASESEGILGSLIGQRARLQAQGDMAMEFGDIRGCVAVENAITANLKLTAGLLGQLVTHHSVTHTNLLVSADYLRLRQTLITTLKRFPEAAKAVSAALYALESDAAAEISDAAKPVPAAPRVIEHVATKPGRLPPPPAVADRAPQ